MKEQFENIYHDLTELEHLLDQVIGIPGELFDIPGELFDMQYEWTERQFEWLERQFEWTERQFEWMEEKVSRKDAPFGSYMEFFDRVIHRLYILVNGGVDYIVSFPEILEEDEHGMIMQILEELSSFIRMNGMISVGRLLLTHHALIRLFDYLEMRSEPDGLAFYLFRKSSRKLFRSYIWYLYDTLELLEIAALGHYSHFITQAFYADGVKPRVWMTDSRQLATATDQLNDGIKFAQLAYGQSKIIKGYMTTLHPYIIHFGHGIQGKQDADGFFHLQRNMNGYIAYTEEQVPRIIYGLTGTKPSSLANWKTNFGQYFCGPNLPYLYAWGILDSILLGKSHRDGFKDSRVEVYGHSLGGGMMQYAVANHPSDIVSGYGYNSAGLGGKTIESMEHFNVSKITHLYLPYDFVFMIPGSFQLGWAVKVAGIPVINLLKAHCLKEMQRRSGRYQHDVACIM